MVHHLRLNENFADAVLSGEKNFEIRQNDRGFQKGDQVDLKLKAKRRLQQHGRQE